MVVIGECGGRSPDVHGATERCWQLVVVAVFVVVALVLTVSDCVLGFDSFNCK